MRFEAWWAQYEKDSDGIMYFVDATEAAWNASRAESEAEITALKSERDTAHAAAIQAAADNCRVRALSEMVMRDKARANGDMELSNAHGDRAAVLQEQEQAIRALASASAEDELNARLKAEHS